MVLYNLDLTTRGSTRLINGTNKERRRPDLDSEEPNTIFLIASSIASA
jgi:hypothetical protein